MKEKVCSVCGSSIIDVTNKNICFCFQCGKERKWREMTREEKKENEKSRWTDTNVVVSDKD